MRALQRAEEVRQEWRLEQEEFEMNHYGSWLTYSGGEVRRAQPVHSGWITRFGHVHRGQARSQSVRASQNSGGGKR